MYQWWMADLLKLTPLVTCTTDQQVTSYGCGHGVSPSDWQSRIYKWITETILVQDKSGSQDTFDQSTHVDRWHHQRKWEVIWDLTLMLLVGIKRNTRHDHLAIGIIRPRHWKGYPVWKISCAVWERIYASHSKQWSHKHLGEPDRTIWRPKLCFNSRIADLAAFDHGV